MSLFATIFAVLTLSLFWGGFVFLLGYSLKLKKSVQADDDQEENS